MASSEETGRESQYSSAARDLYADVSAFTDAIRSALPSANRLGRSVVLIAVELGRLKKVRDVFGRPVAESIGRQAFESLKDSFRKDDVVGKLDEDVYAVLCRDVKSPEDAMDLVNKAKGAFERCFDNDSRLFALHPCYGIALYPADAEDLDEFVHAALAACRMAIENGPGSFLFFDPRTRAELARRYRVEEELSVAIDQDLIEPWFQGVYDARGDLVGAEALARWRLPDGQLRYPAEFISVAERSGDIDKLGMGMLRKACARAAAWQQATGRPVRVAVNLSPRQFRDPLLGTAIEAALAESGLHPRSLEIEVTESGLGENPQEIGLVLTRLRNLGVKVAIDDFGTGFSSILKLIDYPVDKVKLPMEFVRGLPDDPKCVTISKAIINLAHDLGFAVVAEGVETDEQLSWLRETGCDEYQGFLLARPVDSETFARHVDRGSEQAD